MKHTRYAVTHEDGSAYLGRRKLRLQEFQEPERAQREWIRSQCLGP